MENEIKSTNNQSLKIQLSLASLMFFSPFIQHLLKKENLEINEQDRSFVEGYISIGWINLILLGGTIISGILSYYFDYSLLNTIYYIFIGTLVILLSIGSVSALLEIGIKTNGSAETLHTEYTNPDKARTLLSYLPGYSIYLRYTKHNFDTPDLLLKESLIVWTIFGLMCFLPSSFFVLVITIGILVRIVALLGNISLVSKSISDFLSSLFYKNPEELWAYIRGSIVFLFRGTYTLSYWKFSIEEVKKEYQYLYDIKKFGTIQRQYFLFFVSCVFLFWQVDLGHIPGLAILAIVLLFVRYGVMLFFRKRSPALPIFRELVAIPLLFISKK